MKKPPVNGSKELLNEILERAEEQKRQDYLTRTIRNAPPLPVVRGVSWRLKFGDRPLTAMSYVALDLETTGKDPHLDLPLEIGAIRFRLDSAEEKVFHALVNPGRRIHPQAQATHGLTDAVVAGMPPLAEALSGLVKFFEEEPDTIVLAHNAAFDANIVGFCLYRFHIRFPECPYLCTWSLARRRVNGLHLSGDEYGLERLAQIFGLAERQPHRALPDARLLKELFLRFVASQPSSRVYPYPPSRVEQLFVDSKYRPKDPAFFAELPLAVEVPTKFRDLRGALEQRTPVFLHLAADGERGRCHIRVIPLWFNKAGNLLVVEHQDGQEQAIPVSTIQAHAPENK